MPAKDRGKREKTQLRGSSKIKRGAYDFVSAPLTLIT
jgi:hypothetical protein